jgi:class 3 adenylate cyclase
MAHEHHYLWTYDLKSSPEALWPLASDTNRFNRDTFLPPMQLIGIENKIRRVKFKIPIIRIEWDEEPFEWTYPQRFGVLRRYRTGPLKEMRVDCRFERLEPSGTRVHYEVWVTARNLFGDAAVALGIGIFSAKLFERVFHQYDRIASLGRTILEIAKGRNLTPAGHNRFKVLNDRLKEQGVGEPLLNHLYEFVHRADDISVQRMRPYALADTWGLARRTVLEGFLRATRIGMLDLYWDILCPECRGVTEDQAHLSDIHARSHCNTCQIDFTANFDHNVEVIFRPNPSIRSVDATLEFCVGSPQRQPHVALSLTVPSREELPLDVVLEPGRYSMRSPAIFGSQAILATKDGVSSADIFARETGWPTDLTRISLTPRIKLVNDTGQDLNFELIRTAWSDQAATAADVTILQTFRDLFSTEVLRPGEEISVGSVTLMFTDLRGSTKLYREIGDAPAFGRVREHFEVLERAVNTEGGSIVKTMGDAIMAAFRNPSSAVRAIWNVQRELSSRGQPPLSIKVGIHHGPCIVVNLNDRLDYFGSTVNISARLPHFSQGGEVIITEAIRNDQEVLAFLERNAKPNSIFRFQGEIRGYEQSMELWKINM